MRTLISSRARTDDRRHALSLPASLQATLLISPALHKTPTPPNSRMRFIFPHHSFVSNHSRLPNAIKTCFTDIYQQTSSSIYQNCHAHCLRVLFSTSLPFQQPTLNKRRDCDSNKQSNRFRRIRQSPCNQPCLAQTNSSETPALHTHASVSISQRNVIAGWHKPTLTSTNPITTG